MTYEERILAEFLKELPIGLALPRAAECLAFKKTGLEGPVLDIGCGDGLFAKICFGKRMIEAGLDLNSGEIKRANKNQAYQKTAAASAGAIPFPDGYFQTVIANSVLEHIEGGLAPVLKEINRVLKKKGRLVFTVPRPIIADCLFFPRLFRSLKLDWLAARYIGLKQRFWQHHYLLEKKEWQGFLEKTGFKMGKSFTLISKEAVVLHDIFYPLAFPYAIGKKLFGRAFVFCPGRLAGFLAQRLAGYCQVFEGDEGTTLFIEAVKI